MPKEIDETGNRYGMLLVERRAASYNGAAWWVVCDCGNKTIVRGGNLRAGNHESCGCLRLKTLKENAARMKTSTQIGRRAFDQSQIRRKAGLVSNK